MPNDFTYTVRASGGITTATGDLTLARVEAMKAAKAMTAKGGATGHVLIDYWTKSVVTDTEHVYDDGTAAEVEVETISAYAAELRRRHDRIAVGLTAFRSVSPLPTRSTREIVTADVTMQAARDHVWAQFRAEVEKVNA